MVFVIVRLSVYEHDAQAALVSIWFFQCYLFFTKEAMIIDVAIAI